ncbi:MAG: mandelate racemase/muconate lactonizing enzyme family protein [Methyloligellaceae bacterium]
MRIEFIDLYRVNLPLKVPYRLSYRTFESFEPILVRVCDNDGREGWGEQHISPGSSSETREGGWAFVNTISEDLPGKTIAEAMSHVNEAANESKVAAAALFTALEMAANPEKLIASRDVRLPLLTPFNATEHREVRDEVAQRLDEGFGTFKVKVGKDVAADLARVKEIQKAADGRATLRIDANRAFSRDDAIAFATRINPGGIELFEQPCDAEDWEANGAVAAVSNVPLMLDEPICTLTDIERAATMDGVELCKVKLKRFVSMNALGEAIDRIKELGMTAVLGDGLGADINCWMEACAARDRIENAGEFNGYVKVRPDSRILENPLPFENGHMHLPAGYWPRMDQKLLESQSLESRRYSKSAISLARR